MEIDHVTIPVRDYEASKRFYERALAPLGFVVLLDWPDRRRAYFGLKSRPSSLWLVESSAAGTLQLSLAAPSEGAVDAFHAAALAVGASAGAAPVRTERAYAARIVDPDGNGIEAVHRGDEASRALAA